MNGFEGQDVVIIKIVVHEFILITNEPPAHGTWKFTVYIF